MALKNEDILAPSLLMTTVWITGGKGFIGRNLAKYIATHQCDVFGIGHGFWTSQESAKWSYSTWLNAEIDFSSLNHLVTQSGLPDVIYHLAGGSAVGASIQNPYEDFQRTVDTTARLLEWVRQISPKTKVVGISSAAVYGAEFSQPIKETEIGKPYSPYGFHKSMLEDLFKSYKTTFNLDMAIVRLFSVYGSGLEKQLLWDICNKIVSSTDNKILLNGSGNELRDWLHINDAVKLIKLIADSDSDDLLHNGGTGVGTSIKSIATNIANAWGNKFEVVFNNICRDGDPQYLVANIDKVKGLGFCPSVEIGTGLVDFVGWFKANKI